MPPTPPPPKQWAAISIVVVSQPMLGKAAQLGVNRIFGTCLGAIRQLPLFSRF